MGFMFFVIRTFNLPGILELCSMAEDGAVEQAAPVLQVLVCEDV